MKGLIVMMAAMTQLVILIAVSSRYGLRAGVLCMLGMIANAVQGAAVNSPNVDEEDETEAETGSDNEEE